MINFVREPFPLGIPCWEAAKGIFLSDIILSFIDCKRVSGEPIFSLKDAPLREKSGELPPDAGGSVQDLQKLVPSFFV